jgi:hypothetical protein
MLLLVVVKSTREHSSMGAAAPFVGNDSSSSFEKNK